MFWAYVLENAQGRFYVGHTDDLAVRLANHNRAHGGSGKYAPKHGPWQLVWFEQHPTRAVAAQRERQITAMKFPKWVHQTLRNSGVPQF